MAKRSEDSLSRRIDAGCASSGHATTVAQDCRQRKTGLESLDAGELPTA